jgi:hypothetical protein
MKIKMLLSSALLAMVAMVFTLPLQAQSLNLPGHQIRWTADLRGPTVGGATGSAEYTSFRAAVAPPSTANGKLFTKFTVVVDSVVAANSSMLDVFVGPATNPNEPLGKLVGTIEIEGGSGALVLVAAKTPAIAKGSTVSIVHHGDTAAGVLILEGKF